jgi:hypothetical protein
MLVGAVLQFGSLRSQSHIESHVVAGSDRVKLNGLLSPGVVAGTALQ